MSSDQPDLQKLYNALKTVGHNADLRARMVAECKHIEATLDYPGKSIRDDITGPIVDALYADAGVLRKKLSTGLVFDFHYRSKIAREFVMSTPEVPDHVWEPQTTKLLLHLAKKAKNVLIGGAYFGDQAVPVAREIAANQGTLHAFELNADQSAMLAHNAELNGLKNIRVNQLGLWNDDTTRLGLMGDDSFAYPKEIDGKADEQPSNTITVDTYLRKAGIENVDLIMLDIEGGELNVLKGAIGQLSLPAGKAPNIVFEVHRHYVDWSKGLENTEIVKLVRSHGYTVFSLRDFQENRKMTGKPIELVPPETTYLEGPPHGFNMVAVKDPSIVQGEGFKVVQNVSPKLLVHKTPSLHHPTDGL